MNGKRGTKRIVDLKEITWIELPRIGQVLKTLDENGVAHVIGENPEFAGAPCCVHLGLCVHARGPQIRYGTPDSPMEGDYFYAEVQKSGSFDIYLKAQSLSNQPVTIVWCAIPHTSRCLIGPTVGPTPTLSLPPIGLTSRRFKASDFPRRYVDEVPGIGSEFIGRLARARIKSLATLASADAAHVARILNVSEVRAMGFIYEARRLLQGKTRK
jgi:hypothetical protein